MFIFPAHLFNPTSVQAKIARATVSGGTSLSGEEDHVITDGGGRWEISYDGISLDDPDALAAWETWNGYLAAGTVDVLVPLLSLETAPRPAIGKQRMPPSALASDDPLFPTAVGFAAPYIIATIAADAALRATTIRIAMTRGAPIRGGEKFSIARRAYRIARKIGDDTFKIEPPLRDPIYAGAAVNFDWPVVQCRSAPGEDWSPVVDLGLYADTTIRFVESFAA